MEIIALLKLQRNMHNARCWRRTASKPGGGQRQIMFTSYCMVTVSCITL